MRGLSGNTASKWLPAPVVEEPKYRREARPTKLSAYHERLELELNADARRPKQERRTAKALFEEIKAAGYKGGYTTVTDFIRQWRVAQRQRDSHKAFVPLQFELGEAVQFDWSEEGLVVGGIYYRMQVAHMKLCASCQRSAYTGHSRVGINRPPEPEGGEGRSRHVPARAQSA